MRRGVAVALLAQPPIILWHVVFLFLVCLSRLITRPQVVRFPQVDRDGPHEISKEAYNLSNEAHDLWVDSDGLHNLQVNSAAGRGRRAAGPPPPARGAGNGSGFTPRRPRRPPRIPPRRRRRIRRWGIDAARRFKG